MLLLLLLLLTTSFPFFFCSLSLVDISHTVAMWFVSCRFKYMFILHLLHFLFGIRVLARSFSTSHLFACLPLFACCSLSSLSLSMLFVIFVHLLAGCVCVCVSLFLILPFYVWKYSLLFYFLEISWEEFNLSSLNKISVYDECRVKVKECSMVKSVKCFGGKNVFPNKWMHNRSK